jgi:hypothetical protein
MRVYKYKLRLTDFQGIDLPVGAKILTVQEQRGEIQLWALVDQDQDHTERRFIEIAGTGHDILNDVKDYITTFQQLGGNLVWHVFETK